MLAQPTLQKTSRPDGYPLHFEGAHAGIRLLIDSWSECTGAIICPGVSIEGIDFGRLGVDVTIGVNEIPKLYHPNILVYCDHRGLAKAWDSIDHYETQHIVMANRTMHWMCTQPPAPIGDAMRASMVQAQNLYYAKFTTSMDDVRQAEDASQFVFYNRSIVTAALSLAVAIGLKICYIYGLDLYRRWGSKYAFDIGDAGIEPLTTIAGHERIYTTPAYEGMKGWINGNAHLWEGPEFINMSRFSQVTAWPISKDALPRKDVD